MINWYEVAINIIIAVTISGTISYFIARHFKLNVKPKIEEIYEHNRDYRIGAITSVLELSDWNMKEIFEILEHNNCVGPDFRRVDLSDAVSNQVQQNYFRLKEAYDDVYNRIAEAKQYTAGDELLIFLDFINYSMVFADMLRNGEYSPQYLRQRGIVAKKMIKWYSDFFTEEFRRDWEIIEDYRLE